MQPCSLTDKVEPESIGAAHIAGDPAVQVQAAGKIEIALHPHGSCAQEVSIRACLGFDARANMAIGRRSTGRSG